MPSWSANSNEMNQIALIGMGGNSNTILRSGQSRLKAVSTP